MARYNVSNLPCLTSTQVPKQFGNSDLWAFGTIPVYILLTRVFSTSETTSLYIHSNTIRGQERGLVFTHEIMI